MSPTNIPSTIKPPSHLNPTTYHDYELEPEPYPEPSFICTICWQPQLPPANPKLLGTSARITCLDCWRAVLDLSVCWVCGECIVRGDDVVSLGWCFWHRKCFGCLVCGQGMCVPGEDGIKKEGDRFGNARTRGKGKGVGEVRGPWGNWEEDGEKRKRCVGVGVELFEIPLCEVCTAETAGDSRNKIFQKGLDTVSKFDGGLSRDRLKMMSEDGRDLKIAERRRLQSTRKPRARTFGEVSAKTSRELIREAYLDDDRTPLLKNAAAMGSSREYKNTELLDYGNGGKATITRIEPQHTNPEILVSSYDPVNISSYVPATNRPLPKWMELLPSNVDRARECGHFHEGPQSREPYLTGGPIRFMSGDGSDNPFEDKSHILAPTPRVSFNVGSISTTPPEKIQHTRKRSISFGSKITREHTFTEPGSSSRRRSRTIEDIPPTPHESFSTALPPRERTPFPHMSETDVDGAQTPSYFSSSRSNSVCSPPPQEWCCESPRMLKRSYAPSPEAPASPPMARPRLGRKNASSVLSSPGSSEHLNRYKILTPERKIDTCVTPEPEPLAQTMKRRKIGEGQWTAKMADVADVGFGSDEMMAGAVRDKLHRELKELFRGKQ